MVTWREASPQDPAARILLDQYFDARTAGFARDHRDYRRPTPDASDFVPPQGVFLLVEGENLAGEPADVGCGGVRRLADGPLGTRFELKHLWLQPHTRRLGYGRALVDELIRRATAFGGRELVLDTHESLTAAGALYRALGFTPVERFNDNPNATTWLGRPLT